MKINADNQKLEDILNEKFASPDGLFDNFNYLDKFPRATVNGKFSTPSDLPITGDYAQKGPFYIFMTTPDLNIDELTGKTEVDKDSAKKAKDLLGIGHPTSPSYLVNSLNGTKPFIHLLTNLAQGASLSDISLDTIDIGENWDRARMVYPKDSINSRQASTFSIEYNELKGLPLLLLHKLWLDYIEAIAKGELSPKAFYLDNRMIDYASSLFIFTTEPDGMTIEACAKYTGVYPVSISFSGLDMNKQLSYESITVSITYSYNYYEVFLPVLLNEFNRISNPRFLGGDTESEESTENNPQGYIIRDDSPLNNITRNIDADAWVTNYKNQRYRLVFKETLRY